MASAERAVESFAELVEKYMQVLDTYAMKYSHRNDESDAPTIEGWYWFRGTLDDRDAAGLVKANLPNSAFPTLTVSPMWIDGWIKADRLSGQWWGPILPPWGES